MYTFVMEVLEKRLREYERANNSHIWENVEIFIHPKASYFFTDGTYNGIEEIKEAVQDTFEKIQDEVYTISNTKWVHADENVAICTYNFHWEGLIDGKPAQGSGRGTNVWIKTEEGWQVIHEHLSK